MKVKIPAFAQTFHPARLPVLAAYLLKDEAISGKLILAATALALLVANSPFGGLYESFWHTKLSVGLGQWALVQDLRHWVNDGLMAFFFLVVGLELKRELIRGELRKFETALLPFVAAIGGMIIPAAIYLALNVGTEGVRGWAIPMATDIALAVGILALLGHRIPPSVRLFLLTLAIVDDIGAVIIIAMFYNTALNYAMLALAAGICVAVLALHQLKRLTMPVFVAAGVALWLVIFSSGIHASIAGVIVGLLAPVSIKRMRKESISERMERITIPFSVLFVVPLFAFANTGIALTLSGFSQPAAVPIAGGIVLGLVAGKLLGILGASWLLIKSGHAELPEGATWSHIAGVGLLAGIGFTVSIFVTDLAFTDEGYITVAKLSIIVASALSALLGLLVLRYMTGRPGRTQAR